MPAVKWSDPVPHPGRRRRKVQQGSIALVLLVLILWIVWGGGKDVLFIRQDRTWNAMQARGAWRVGMDPSFPPFEYLDESGLPVGLDADLAAAIAQNWDLEVQIVAIGFDSLMDALQAGKIDSIVSAVPFDPRETEDFTFSKPYFDAGIRLVVMDGSQVADIDALTGRRIAVEWGSMGDMVGRTLQRDGLDIELVPFSTPEEAVAALVEEENIDALLIDNVTLHEAQGSGISIVGIGPIIESNPYVIVSPLRSGELRDHIAETLLEFQETGVMTRLEAKWFGTERP